MASYTISPIWGAGAQLFTNSGVPLAGGKIYTYIAGTTTPLTTYTDPTGSIANSNPIIADAAGRLSNEIWLPVNGAYKFVLRDASDALIATYDNIPTIAQPPVVNDASSITYEPGYSVTAGNFTIGATYLITSVGTTDFVAIGAAANVTGIHFTATGVGSGTGTAEYSRFVQDKLRETYSVKDFGAVGDGTTDDTAAIQAAIDYVTAVGGGTVFVPEGEYLTTSAINITFHKIRLEGSQEYASVILSDHTGVAINLATNNQPYIGHLHIKRSTGQGTRGSRTGTGLRVFGDFAGGSSIQCHVEYVRIDGFSRGLDLYACFLSSFSYLTMKWNDISYYFNNNTNDSITFFACQSNTLISQHIYATSSATAEVGASFVNCEFEGSFKFPAIQVNGAQAFFFQFVDCYLYENNFGSDPGSTFNFMEFDVAGYLRIKGSGVNAAGKQDARLIFGRRNASTVKWNVSIDQCLIQDWRITGPTIDLDLTDPIDKLYVSPSCVYRPVLPASTFLTVDQQAANSLYKEQKINYTDTRYVRLQGSNTSTGVNDLDSYEEGTWEPALTDDSFNTSEGQTYSVQFGRYTKIGDKVFINMRMTMTGLGTLTTGDAVRIAGLPFTPNTTANNVFALTVSRVFNVSLGGAYSVAAFCGGGTLGALAYKFSTASGSTILTIAELTASGSIEISGFYQV